MFDEKDLLRELSRDDARTAAAKEFLAKLAADKCDFCKGPATKKLLWANGRAYIPSCDAHVEKVIKAHPKNFGPDSFGNHEGPDGIRPIKKEAGVHELAAAFGQLAKQHAPAIAGATAGAALSSLAMYASNKKGKDGLTRQQKMHRKQVADTEGGLGYSGRMSHAKAKAMSEISDIMADHPIRSSLVAIPAGASAGATLVAMMKKIRSLT